MSKKLTSNFEKFNKKNYYNDKKAILTLKQIISCLNSE